MLLGRAAHYPPQLQSDASCVTAAEDYGYNKPRWENFRRRGDARRTGKWELEEIMATYKARACKQSVLQLRPLSRAWNARYLLRSIDVLRMLKAKV